MLRERRTQLVHGPCCAAAEPSAVFGPRSGAEAGRGKIEATLGGLQQELPVRAIREREPALQTAGAAGVYAAPSERLAFHSLEASGVGSASGQRQARAGYQGKVLLGAARGSLGPARCFGS